MTLRKVWHSCKRMETESDVICWKLELIGMNCHKTGNYDICIVLNSRPVAADGVTLLSGCDIILLLPPPTLRGDKVSMWTHTHPHTFQRKIKVVICNHQADNSYMCGLVFDLVICKHMKEYAHMTLNILTETRCHYSKLKHFFLLTQHLPDVRVYKSCMLLVHLTAATL